MKKFVEIMGGIELLVALVGIVCFFIGHETITLFCAGFSLLHSFLNVVFGEQNGFGTEILTVIVAIVVSMVFHLDMFGVVAVAICIGSVAIMIVPLLLIAVFGRK